MLFRSNPAPFLFFNGPIAIDCRTEQLLSAFHQEDHRLPVSPFRQMQSGPSLGMHASPREDLSAACLGALQNGTPCLLHPYPLQHPSGDRNNAGNPNVACVVCLLAAASLAFSFSAPPAGAASSGCRASYTRLCLPMCQAYTHATAYTHMDIHLCIYSLACHNIA